MQPVQDLTVEDRVSRTQYQYTARGRRREGARRLGTAARREASADPGAARRRERRSRTRGSRPACVLDRTTASRFGITPQMLDDALYDAFGQRQVSTMFTELNQYRVVLETQPNFQQQPRGLEERIPALDRRRRRSARRVHADPDEQRAARDQPPGSVPRRHDLVQPRAGRVARRGRARHRQSAGRSSAFPTASRPSSRGRRPRSALR